MALEDRLRRQPPARGAPRRARLPEVQGEGPKAGPDAPLARAPSAASGSAQPQRSVDQVVAAAYGVLDDNLDQGRRAAERFRAAAPPPSGPPPNAKMVAGRLLHMTREMGVAWIDLVVAILREPEVRAVLERVTPHDRPRAETVDVPRGGVPVTHRVASRKPIEVTLSPLQGSGAVAPAIGGLHALDPAAPPIRAVQFSLRAGGGLEMRIEVPDDQPAGAYFGTVVDGVSQQPMGTLAVRVVD